MYISSFQIYKPNGEQKFWLVWAKAHSAVQTQMVSLQFLWLNVPSLMKCCGIGLQNCKYNEWDANLSYWFLFCRHGKPLLITLKLCQDWVERSFKIFLFSPLIFRARHNEQFCQADIMMLWHRKICYTIIASMIVNQCL